MTNRVQALYRMVRRMWIGLPALALLLSAGVAAADSGIERFYGHFVGQALIDTDGEVTKRDLDVAIAPYKKGFTVEWSTTRHKAGGKVKKSSYKVNFKKSKRSGIFSSAMRVNKFGSEKPLDPLAGDPYLWGQIDGDTLVIHSLLILDDGGYEMQTYERTLSEGGMDLRFSRVRNGLILKAITAKLKKEAN